MVVQQCHISPILEFDPRDKMEDYSSAITPRHPNWTDNLRNLEHRRSSPLIQNLEIILLPIKNAEFDTLEVRYLGRRQTFLSEEHPRISRVCVALVRSPLPNNGLIGCKETS